MISQIRSIKIRKFTILRLFSTKDESEVKKFNTVQDWWNPNGSMRGLHAYNPLRIDFLRRNMIKTGKATPGHNFMSNHTVMDVGSGGGLFVEAVSRFGPQKVTGVDANEFCVEVANLHKQQQKGFGANIEYVNTLLEDYNDTDCFEPYDVVTAFEIIEHCGDQQQFMDELSSSVKPGGLVLMSTMYKNYQAWLFTIALGETLTGVVPTGTHDYEKYLDKDVLVDMAQNSGLELIDFRNTFYIPISNTVDYVDFLESNYIVCFEKPEIEQIQSTPPSPSPIDLAQQKQYLQQ